MTIVGGSGPGSVAQYSCNAGFELVGERRRVCSRNGLFSGSAPICRRTFQSYTSRYVAQFWIQNRLFNA